MLTRPFLQLMDVVNGRVAERGFPNLSPMLSNLKPSPELEDLYNCNLSTDYESPVIAPPD